MGYTVIGDGVNVAARLEGINKEFGTRICISHSVFKEAGERLCVRPIDDVTVKGRRTKIPIYELMGAFGDDPQLEPDPPTLRLCKLTRVAYEALVQENSAVALVALSAGAGGISGRSGGARDESPAFSGERTGADATPRDRLICRPVSAEDEVAAAGWLRPSEYTAALINVLRGRAAWVRGADVLEIGSGSGVVLAALGALGAASLCGIDIEHDAVVSGELLLRQLGHGGNARTPPRRHVGAGRRSSLRP